MAVWRDVARRHAFVEYDGPPLEPLDLYTRKSGDEIVGQLYNFTDKGGRDVALRPEMTPTLARMVAARANALRKPVRWFSMPQLFRYERQQRGRLREHFQLNVDIIGESDVTADAELLAVAIEIMRGFELGPGDVVARVSDRRLLRALLLHIGIEEERHATVFAVVDKIDRDPRDVLERRLSDAGVGDDSRRRLFETLAARDLATLRSMMGSDPALAEHFERFDRYLGHLTALGVADWVRFDLSIVRGLAYYTGIVFELFDARGRFRAICGGGRYDTLLQSLGGADLPALGFGMGDVVVGELLRDRGLMPGGDATLDFWVAGEDDALVGDVMRIAAALRKRGRSVEYALRSQTLSRQLKTAASAGARHAVMLRRGDLSQGRATVRTMSDGAETSVELEAWLASA
jgi:histidyl-tRNA synthetase